MTRAAHASPNAAAWLRSAAIAVVWGVLVIGQAYAVVARKDAWPLSHYPMYADTQGPNVSAVQIEGRAADGSVHHVSVRDELSPLDPSRLLGLIRRVSRGANKQERQLAAARALLTLYEKHRTAGDHDGPPLTEISVYETTWRILPGAENRDRPSKRRLIASTRPGAS